MNYMFYNKYYLNIEKDDLKTWKKLFDKLFITFKCNWKN